MAERRVRHGGRASNSGSGGRRNDAGPRGGDPVRVVLVASPTENAVRAVRQLARATGLGRQQATEAIAAASAAGTAQLFETHRELGELHAERCRHAGLEVRLELARGG